MTTLFAPCSKIITACKAPAKKEESDFDDDFSFEIIEINFADLMPQGIDSRMVSFGRFEKAPEKVLISPAVFNNEKYNITLKVSQASSLTGYKDFQQTLAFMSKAFNTTILNYVKTTKPAAITVETDKVSARQSGDPMLGMMAMMADMEDEDTINLVKAVNFVSEDGDNMLMPPCQLQKALRHGHLCKSSSGEQLTVNEYRKFEANFEKDLEKEPAVANGKIKVRSVQ